VNWVLEGLADLVRLLVLYHQMGLVHLMGLAVHSDQQVH
jgi:hypothetical protein